MSPQPYLHAVTAALLFGRLATVLLQRLFDVVAIGRLKVAPFDACQALIEDELIAAVAKAEADNQFSAAVGALNALRAMVVQPQLDRQFEMHFRRHYSRKA